jgi:S-layer protein (TIGR01567 family)
MRQVSVDLIFTEGGINMNKRTIVLITLVAVVLAMPASAETIEVRSNVVNVSGTDMTVDMVWTAHNFGAFWYDLNDDLSTETLTLEGGTINVSDDTIDEDSLIYQTCPVYKTYDLYAFEGLSVAGDNGYYLEGWIGEPYVAVNGNADKLCKLLVEFWDDDVKTLETGEEWDLGGGFTLELTDIDYAGEKATVKLSKNGSLLDTGYLDTSGSEQDRVYTYTDDIGGESNVPIFSCYVDVIDSDTNTVAIMYVFLIDNEVLDIDTGRDFGVMEVTTASSLRVVLKNEDNTIDLSKDTTEHIMGNMYFKTADDDKHIRFYLFVEYTEPGTYEVRGNVVNVSNTDMTVDMVWNAHNFGAFWYDLDDDLSTECLVLAGGAISDSDRTINENYLIYTTMPVYQCYELWNCEMLTVDGDTYTLKRGYYIEGWLAEEYIAVNDNADKLVKLLVEFEGNEMHVLYSDAAWDLGGGFVFELLGIDDTGDKATLRLSKDGTPLAGSRKCIDTGTGTRQDRVYTYTADIGGEDDVPVFSCYVDSVFKGGDVSYVQLKYAFLIDDDVLEIETSETYGAMDVVTANGNEIILRNEYDLDLDPDTTKHIMGDLYFETADDADHIRFYPFVNRTTSGEENEEEEDTIPAADSDNDGVPDVWDLDNSTPADYWTDSDGRGRMWGDMNGDGKLTSVDALMILQAVVGKIDL